jgi:hypothetical protein
MVWKYPGDDPIELVDLEYIELFQCYGGIQ